MGCQPPSSAWDSLPSSPHCPGRQTPVSILPGKSEVEQRQQVASWRRSGPQHRDLEPRGLCQAFPNSRASGGFLVSLSPHGSLHWLPAGLLIVTQQPSPRRARRGSSTTVPMCTRVSGRNGAAHRSALSGPGGRGSGLVAAPLSTLVRIWDPSHRGGRWAWLPRWSRQVLSFLQDAMPSLCKENRSPRLGF